MFYLQARPGSRGEWQTIAGAEGVTGECDTLKEKLPGYEFRVVEKDQVSNQVDASWSISLDAECPFCFEPFDILEHDAEVIQDVGLCEHGTKRTRALPTECPGCNAELIVDLTY